MQNYHKSGLKIARERMNLKDYELATKLKIDVAVIKSWEAGIGIIPLPMIKKLTKTLSTTSDMLLFSENRKPLDISSLTSEQKDYVIQLYELMKKAKN